MTYGQDLNEIFQKIKKKNNNITHINANIVVQKREKKQEGNSNNNKRRLKRDKKNAQKINKLVNYN